MSTEQNKQTVMRLMDVLRAGDFDQLDDLIAKDLVQHNPLAGNGLDTIKEHFTAGGPIDLEVARVIAEGDFVALHAHFKSWGQASVDIFRFGADGKIVEHWDVLQTVPETTANGHDMFSQLT